MLWQPEFNFNRRDKSPAELKELNPPFSITRKIVETFNIARNNYLREKKVIEPDMEESEYKWPRWKIGFLAEKLGEIDFALGVYETMRKQACSIHLRWKINNKGIDELLTKVQDEDAATIANIFVHEGNREIAKQFRFKAREGFRTNHDWLNAAEQAEKNGRYDLALEDLKGYEKSAQFYHIDTLKSFRSITRRAKKNKAAEFKEMFYYLARMYKEETSQEDTTYSVARMYWEGGDKKQALAWFKKAKCFKRARDIEVNIYKKSSEETSKLHIKKLLEERLMDFLGEKEDYIWEKVRTHCSKAFQWAKTDFQQRYLFSLLKKRFLLQPALDYAKEQGFRTDSLQQTITQKKRFKKIMNFNFWKHYCGIDYDKKDLFNSLKDIKEQDSNFLNNLLTRFSDLEAGKFEIFGEGLIEVSPLIQHYFIVNYLSHEMKNELDDKYGEITIPINNGLENNCCPTNVFYIEKKGLASIEYLCKRGHSVYVSEQIPAFQCFDKNSKWVKRLNEILTKAENNAVRMKEKLGINTDKFITGTAY